LGIVLLDLEGKLSVDDEIQKHLPDMPQFEKPVTIRHLMHHTSGLRSLHDMLGLAGWRSDDSRSNADLNRFMVNQKELNFEPGAEHLYCNTGFMFMADIIESVTGESFPEWSKKNIFEPLGMENSYVEDDYARVVPKNATSYNASRENGFSRAVEYWGYVGSGNMHSTTADLLTYLKNYHQPQEGWQEAFEKMQTLGVLNNGDTLDYAFGVKIDSYQDLRRVQHGGSIGGFRSFIASYPDEELDVVVLTNFSTGGPNTIADRMVDIVLDKPEPEKAPRHGNQTPLEIQLASEILNDLEGMYYSPELETFYKITVKDGKITGFHPRHGSFNMIALEEDALQSDLGIFRTVKILKNGNDRINGLSVSNGRVKNLKFEKVSLQNIN
jgi:CubicO group peptidase (beta-lactamase class C family)